jgi:hypothetical protein
MFQLVRMKEMVEREPERRAKMRQWAADWKEGHLFEGKYREEELRKEKETKERLEREERYATQL